MNDCLSYASLSDAAAAGEPLTAEQRLFLRTHPTGCRACGAEASLWETLEQALEDPARLTSAPRKLEQPAASRGHRFQSWLGRRGPSSRRHTLFAAGALLATAAAAAGIAGQSDKPAPMHEPSLAAVPQRVKPAPGSARAVTAPTPSPAIQPESPPFRDPGATADAGPTRDRSDGKVPRPAPSTSAAALLAQARGLRADGRYQEASLVYQRLVREVPRSTEAHIALLSLGELQLSQLRNAAGALRSFDAYLRIGGPLSQEASYGRIRALRQLGRGSDARAASDAFIAAYPNSVQAAALRKEHP